MALVATLAAIVAVVNAQVEPQPTFRSEINYVQIPVRVLDARGEFVRGLTQSDFQVLEDGQPQTITAFSAIDIPFVRHDTAVSDEPGTSGEAIASNEPLEADGRVYVFVLDNQSMGAAVAMRTRHVLRRFIRDSIAANDMTAIVLTGTGRGQPFTRNPHLLYAAIDRLMSDADPSDNSIDRVMKKIADTAKWMGMIKGRRKALVLMTPSSICSLVNRNPAVFSNCNEAARYALRMAMQSDVSIYTIDPLGAVPTHGAPAEVAEAPARRPPTIVRGPLDAARYLAEESGGFAVVNSNSLDAGFARVVREHSSYYLVGYYSTNDRADGTLRRNRITVSRDGLRVVHRGTYLAPREKDLLKGVTTTTSTTLEEQIQELANNPLPVSAMSLRVAAAPFASDESTASVAVVVEIPAATLKMSDVTGGDAARVRLSVGFYDRDGRSVAGVDPMLDLSHVDGDVLRSVSWIAVPPGAYRLWAAAVQTPAGISGSANTDIEIPDFRRPRLSLSGLTVSSGPTPLARRAFAADNDLFLYGEIYDRRAVRGPIRATVTIRSQEGKVAYETPFEPISATPGRQAYIPLKQLGPGAYVATVEVFSATPKRTEVRRSIVFRVSP